MRASFFSSRPQDTAPAAQDIQRLQARITALEEERRGLYSLASDPFSGLALKFSCELRPGSVLTLDHASPQTATWLGATPAALAEQPLRALEVLSPACAVRLQRRFLTSSRRLQAFSELAQLSVRGATRWLKIQVMPERRGDRLVWECLGLDVTALQKAREDEEMQHREQLMFLSALSARLRTPLNTIGGHVQLMQAGPQRLEMNQIHQSCNQLTEILDEVLERTTLNAGALHLTDDPFALGPWLEARAASWGNLATDRSLGFSYSLENCAHIVRTDRQRLGQVLSRLFFACVAEPGPRQVALAVNGQEKDGRLHATLSFTVRSASALEEAKAASEGLARHAVTTELKHHLPWAQQMARHLGGTVGTSVQGDSLYSLQLRINLPLVVPPKSCDEAHRALDILVVDDFISNRLILKRYLETVGHRVREATNGLEAVEAVRQSRPDLVFMDVDMPYMDGCEAARAIGQIHASSAAIPICAITGLSNDEERQRALRHGMKHFIAKPVHFKDVQMVCKWVSSMEST